MWSEDPLKLREIILNTQRPILFKNFKTKWKCRDGSLEDWCQLFDEANNGAEREFEQMEMQSGTRHPQWERERKTVKLRAQQFLQLHKNEQKFWTGLNYQTPAEMPEECKADIDFSCFGFSHLTNENARFWLSSKGANTPCHKDTYGCNIVHQVHGSKSWLLFPPKTKLTSSRLPYEESSIYCLENFYAPAPEQVRDLQRFDSESYICEINAGDVLIVPRHWWHFVETIENSLSVNAWIPLKVDAEDQFQECFVEYLVETVVRAESDDTRKYFLNPNQLNLSSEEEVLGILAYLSEKIASSDGEIEGPKKRRVSYPYQYLGEEAVELLLSEFPNGSYLKGASKQEYEALLNRNAARFVERDSEERETQIRDVKEALINSICSPNIISEISREFQARYNQIKRMHHKSPITSTFPCNKNQAES